MASPPSSKGLRERDKKRTKKKIKVFQMKVQKSSRHRKITGNFSENLVLYLLSKYGYECAIVDHTGIDIIARDSKKQKVMGISVKGRSRNTGKEGTYVSIPNTHFKKVNVACRAFNCDPYFAIVVDEGSIIRVFILSMKHLLKLFPKGERVCAWKMNKKHLERYFEDENIGVFEFNYGKNIRWRQKFL